MSTTCAPRVYLRPEVERRLGAGLVLSAVVCCAAPLLLGTGLAGAALALIRERWGWAAAGAALVVLAFVARLRRAGR